MQRPIQKPSPVCASPSLMTTSLIWTDVSVRAAAARQRSGASYGSRASKGRSTAVLAATAPELTAAPPWHSAATTRSASLATAGRLVHAEGHTLGEGLPGRGVPSLTRDREIAHLAQGFFSMVRERHLPALVLWIAAAKRTALTGFASRLGRDLEAAKAALTLPWNQGHVEGKVHRLKLIKRQMHGRAGSDLLRLRVLQQA